MNKVDTKNCVACNDGMFVGEVGEILKHLCHKHKKEYMRGEIKKVKDYFKIVK